MEINNRLAQLALLLSLVLFSLPAFAQNSLLLTKTFLGPAPPGESTQLRFVIQNSSSLTMSEIAFTDDLDATLSGLVTTGSIPLIPCGVGSSLTGGSVITFANGQLDANETCSFEVEVQVPAGATPGVYTNTTSTITGFAGDSEIMGSAAIDTLYAISGPAVLKEFGTLTIDDGGTIELNFTVGNENPTLAVQDLQFDDNLEAFLPGTTASPGVQNNVCGSGSTLTANDTGSGVVLEFRGGQLPAANGTVPICTFSVTLQLPPAIDPGSYENLTTAISGNLVGGTAPLFVEGNFAEASVTHALAPEFGKSFSGPVNPGGQVDLTFTLDATGLSVPSTLLSFSDDFAAMLDGTTVESVPLTPCGGSVSAGGSSISFNNSGLAAGSSCSFTITLGIDAGATPGFYLNTTSPLLVNTASGFAAADPAAATLEVLGDEPVTPPNPSVPPARPVPTLGPAAWLIMVLLMLGAGYRLRS